MKTSTYPQKKSGHYIMLFLIVVIGTFKMHASQLSPSNSKSKFFLETNRVWLNVTGSNGSFSQTLFGYRSGATNGVDYALDGAFWNDGALSLASLIGDVRYAIQFKGLPFSDADVVPLSFKATQNGTYTFAIDHMDGFFLDQTFIVYLHDTVTNTYTNLKTGNYIFNSNSGMYNNRFELTYSIASINLGTVNQEFTTKNLEIYHAEKSIIIKSGNSLLNNIQLFTMNGQIIYESKNVQSAEIIISNLNISQQTIVVRVTNNDGITVNKKWLYL
jgi:hypothetical protein